jgi:O-antigen/teichoic acid export membrane protein
MFVLAAEALPFFLLGVSNVLYARIDTFVLAKIQGVSALAVYAAAGRIFDFVQVVPTALTAAMLPASVRLMQESPRRLGETISRVVRLGLLFAIPLVVSVVWLAPQITTLLFGHRYSHSGAPLRIMAIGMLFSMVNSPLTLLFYAGQRTKRLVVVPAILLVLNLGMNIVAVSRYSYNGAATVTVITEALGTIALVALIVRCRFDIDLGAILRPAGQLLTVAAILLGELLIVRGVAERMLALSVTYAAALWLLGYPNAKVKQLATALRGRLT